MIGLAGVADPAMVQSMNLNQAVAVVPARAMPAHCLDMGHLEVLVVLEASAFQV